MHCAIIIVITVLICTYVIVISNFYSATQLHVWNRTQYQC